MRKLVASCLAALLAISWFAPPAQAGPEQTVDSSIAVLKELSAVPLKGIPASLLSEAHGVVIIPNLIKVGLVIGGEHGRGVVVVKQKDGSWQAPRFITLTGGSIGPQIGAQGSDIVLVFRTQRSVEGLLKGKFTIGADAAAAAGPVGRRVEAATDSQLKAEILSYSRSRGLFAGISLDGASLRVDGHADRAYYAAAGPGRVPESAAKLVGLIAQLSAPAVVAVIPAVPAPAVAIVPMPVPQPLAEADRLRRDLARAATQLSGRLDNTWRRYLALPIEVFQGGNHPPVPVLREALSRFDVVMANPQYRSLALRQDFQATRNLLQAYINALSAPGRPASNLPPPPPDGSR